MPTVIKVENLSKYYRLGLIGGKTLHDDLSRWWARVRKQPDPLLKIGQEDRRNGNDEYLWALRDINFEVQQGEIVGIIGRNGAGKSTLLKILSRITAPTSGQVKVKGRIASLLEVGTGFHPELTGRENIYLNGAILGMKKAEIDRKFDEIVDFAGIKKFIDTPVKRYSSGMYVRLAFAVAAHLEPEILVVDEVLAVGDAEFQKKCLGKMGEVANAGRTVLFVSHNMAAIAQLCTDAVLLERGQVSARGVPKDVTVSYLLSIEPSHSQNGIITHDMHAHEPKGFRFTRADLLDSQGQKSTRLFFGEVLHIRCEFDVSQPTSDLRMGIALHKIDGSLVCALHQTDDPNQELLQLTPGRYITDIKIDVPLLAGAYSIDLFAKPLRGYWTKGSSIDWVPHALNFQIEEMLRDGSYTLATNGIILPKCQWIVCHTNKHERREEKYI